MANDAKVTNVDIEVDNVHRVAIIRVTSAPGNYLLNDVNFGFSELPPDIQVAILSWTRGG